MKVTQITIGRFHHFHLARQLVKYELLNKIYTGYPSFKLKDEKGIPSSKIVTFPWLHAPYMKRGKLGLDRFDWLNKQWQWYDSTLLDKYVSGKISEQGILIALSGSGRFSGKKMQSIGGVHICDRGSSHIRYQDETLKEEYEKWGLKYQGIDKKIIYRGENEYNEADFITVPSEFVKQSFIQKGIDKKKLVKIPYGASLDRFKKIGYPPTNKFRVLWVGGISIRKGFLYALKAFQNLDHPHKEFVVIGAIEEQIKPLLKTFNLDQVQFKGQIPNNELLKYYSTSHVFILASLEEGLAMVQGEALACGCPVIATTNTGAADLFTDGKEGYIVSIRNVDELTEKLQLLADNPGFRDEMSNKAIIRTKKIGGWDTYGNNMFKFLTNISKNEFHK